MTIIYLSGITLLQMGVTSQYDITTIPGGLLHHHFTLTISEQQKWRFISVELALHYCSFLLGSILPYGVRTFLCF